MPTEIFIFLKSVYGVLKNMILLEQEVNAFDPSPFKWKILTGLKGRNASLNFRGNAYRLGNEYFKGKIDIICVILINKTRQRRPDVSKFYMYLIICTVFL